MSRSRRGDAPKTPKTQGRRPAGGSARDDDRTGMGMGSGIGAAALDNPVAAGGTLVMALTASLIVANATFFQTTRHQAPLVHTRDMPASVQDVGQQAPDPTALRRQKLVREVQIELRRLGMYEGTLDGLVGPATERGVRAWERARGIPETGAIDDRLLARLAMDDGVSGGAIPVPPLPPQQGQSSSAAPETAPATPASSGPGDIGSLIAASGGAAVPPQNPAAVSAERARISKVQGALADLGYGPITVDGFFGEQTANAIRRFELDRGLAITGEIGPVLERELDRVRRR